MSNFNKDERAIRSSAKFDNEIVTNYLNRVADKIQQKSHLSNKDKFFIICVACRKQLSNLSTREAHVNACNNLTVKDLQAYSASEDANDERLQFANMLFESMNCQEFVAFKHTDKKLYADFLKAQKTRILSNELTFTQAYSIIDKRLRKSLRQFKVSSQFVKLLESAKCRTQVKAIEKFALKSNN